MSDNVVFLKFRNDKLEDDIRAFLACSHCRNKTYVIIHDEVEGFPLLSCAACNAPIGKIGWAE